jgi:hypothetical protein
MRKLKFSRSIYFTDINGEKRFLFRCINYGRKGDELKFIFDHPNRSMAILHFENDQNFPDDVDIISYGELSYHSDGSLLWKLPDYPVEQCNKYDNPHGSGARRTPLNLIDEWEPVVLGNIICYQDCNSIILEDSIFVTVNTKIFSGEPFEYYIFLGHLKYQSPPNNKSEEMIFRIENISKNLDMIIWFRKSDYKGFLFNIGTTTAVNNNNRIRVAEPQLQINKNGSIELDLVILWNTEWNIDIVNETMQLNLATLLKLPPMTIVAKAYLKTNPYLIQLVKLIGFNKGFAIQPSFRKQKISKRLIGILDKDEKGEFLSIGTGTQDHK